MMKFLSYIAFILVFIGALNWGLVAFNFNLVTWLLGTGALSTAVYVIVGIAAIYSAYAFWVHMQTCKRES